MAKAFRHEDVNAVPRGYRVRTIHSGDHEIRVAFPRGSRRRGAGVLVSVLHPQGENPCRMANPSSVYSYAVGLGYPYLRGEGRVAADGRTWLSRVTKDPEGRGPAIFVGWDNVGRKWVIERERDNPSGDHRPGAPELVGEHSGVAMYFEGISYNAPALKLYGFSTDLALKRAIDRKLKQRANPISEVPDPEHPGEMRFADWRVAMLKFISSHWYGRTLSDAEFRHVAKITHMPPTDFDWSFIRDADDDEVREVYDYLKARHPEPGPHRGFNPSLLDEIRHGDRVTILVPAGFGREGQEWKEKTGRAVMRGPSGWVLNMGGPHGTPGVANERNIVKVRRSNPEKTPSPRKGESAAAYHERRVREILAKMPKPIRDVFDRNPAEYRFVFHNPDDDSLREAGRLYETFHGREPREVLEMQEGAEGRQDFTALGDLVELTFIAPSGDEVQIKFQTSDGVRLASSPEGTQLYLIGGNQDISGSLKLFAADDSKDLVDLGDAKQIVYEASKWQTDFSPQEWKHDFGEESGVRPRGFYDQLKRRIGFAGGNYEVKRPGIVD